MRDTVSQEAASFQACDHRTALAISREYQSIASGLPALRLKGMYDEITLTSLGEPLNLENSIELEKDA